MFIQFMKHKDLHIKLYKFLNFHLKNFSLSLLKQNFYKEYRFQLFLNSLDLYIMSKKKYFYLYFYFHLLYLFINMKTFSHFQPNQQNLASIRKSRNHHSIIEAHISHINGKLYVNDLNNDSSRSLHNVYQLLLILKLVKSLINLLPLPLLHFLYKTLSKIKK